MGLDTIGARPYKRTFENLPPTWKLMGCFVANLIIGPFTLSTSCRRTHLGANANKFALYCIPCLTYLMIILCLLLELAYQGVWVFAIFFYLAFCCQVAVARCS